MKRPRQQKPLEVVARDANWRRGQILALEQHMHRVVHDVAPHSDALLGVVSGFTRALLRHLEQWEQRARSGLVRERGSRMPPAFGNFLSRSRS